MRDPLNTARTRRYTIGGILTGKQVRTAADVAAVAAFVAASSLTTLDGATFGLFDSPVADDSCSITSGAATLTSPNNPWVAGDVGKAIDVQGAGAAGATLRTRIKTFNSAGSVDVWDTAGTTVAATSTSAGGLAVWGNDLSMTRSLPVWQNEGATAEYSKAVETILASTSPTGRTLAARFAEIANVMDFGATGLGLVDDSAAIQRAIDSRPANLGGIVFLPAGSYLLSTALVLKKGVRLLGASNYSTYLLNSVSGIAELVTTLSGDSDMEVADIQLQVANASDVAIHVKGVSRCKIRDCRFYTTVATGTIAIKLDQNSVAGAYNHCIENNDIQGFGFGITCAGVLTTTTFRDNKIQADSGIYLTGASAGSGGNLHVGNLLQSLTGTQGTPVGQGIALTNSAGDVMVGNFIERYAQGIQTNAGCAGVIILPQTGFDHCTTQINLSSNDDAYLVNWQTDGSGGQLRGGHHSFEFNRTAGTLGFKDQVNNRTPLTLDANGFVGLNGTRLTDVPYSFAGNNETMEPGKASFVTITGNGSARTGAILGKTGASNGQTLRILANSWGVTFAATNCVFAAAGVPVFGNGAGNVAVMDLVYSAAEGKWYECSRMTRA